MGPEARRVLMRSGLSTLLVIILLVAGGLYVRSLVAGSFAYARSLRETRVAAYDALRYMLDEETGLRGFAATRDRQFLEPYTEALAPFEGTVRSLRADVATIDIPDAGGRVENLAALNAEYLRTVAAPLLRAPRNTLAIQIRGKGLVDRFRADVAQIDELISDRERMLTRGVQTALDRIGLLVSGAIVAVLLLSFFSVRQQLALASRLQEERLAAESHGREAELLRSAYLAEKRIADTLQDAFVQRPLPTHPTLRFSATYVPATEESRVGGDWYDAIELPEGRVLFAIGDVTGHGIDAAVTMNRVRQALITSALVGVVPADLLARVARELFANSSPLVTAVVGYADAKTYEFVYATAGHPPPLLMEPGRPPRLLPCGSLPLGATADAQYRNHRVQSVPGSTLVLYTDGAIEHTRDVIEGERVLLEAAAAASHAQAPDPASYIHAKIFETHRSADDVAILTVGFNVEHALDVRVAADVFAEPAGAAAFRASDGPAAPNANGTRRFRRRREAA